MKLNLEENKAYFDTGEELGEIVISHIQDFKDKYDRKRSQVLILEIKIKDIAAYQKLVMFEPPEDKLQTRKVTVHDSSTEENTEDGVSSTSN